jgi:1-acyl-sn-glycerol-3-phosphate acyltransferase
MKVLIHIILRVFIQLYFGISGVEMITEKRCIVIANHNSHIDTFALFTLFPLLKINKVKAVAAKDHFKSGPKGFIARYILNALLIDRHSQSHKQSPLHRVEVALRRGYSVILYPEGSRGKPGVIGCFKSGIGDLAEHLPDVPIYPVYLNGIEKTLPRNEVLLVPFNISVRVLPKVYGKDMINQFGAHSRKKITEVLEDSIKNAAQEEKLVAATFS